MHIINKNILSKTLFWISAGWLFAACNTSKAPNPELASNKAVTFSAQSLRMADNLWRENDAIGIFMLPEGANLSDGTSLKRNACYTTKSDNAMVALFTPRGSADSIVLPNNQNVDFVAYYPFDDVFNGNDVKEFQYKANELLPDFLYSSSAKGIQKAQYEGKSVPLQFHHVMSEIVVNLTYLDGTAVKGATLALDDMRQNARFSLSSGTIEAPATTELRGQIALQEGSDNHYSAILIPLSKGTQTKLIVNIGGKGYTYIPTNANFEAGKRYTFALKLNETGELLPIGGMEGVIHDRDTGATVTGELLPDKEDNTNRPNASNNWMGESGTTMSTYISRLELPRPTGGSKNWYITHVVNGEVNYSLEYDTDSKGPRFVAFTFDAVNKSNNTSRTNAWSWDPIIPQKYAAGSSSNNFGYEGTGYSRGHMVASADRLASAAANKQTFYYTNMSPQLQSFNGGVWQQLEDQVQKWGRTASASKVYYVAKGAVLKEGTVKGSTSSGITVPRYYWMAILLEQGSNYYSIAFLMDHDKSAKVSKLGVFAMSINELEQFTGVDLFFNLPDATEETIEAQDPKSFPSVWGYIF